MIYEYGSDDAPKVFQKSLKLAEMLVNLPKSRKKHFTFIVERNKILSVGWNNGWKTHPLAYKYGYRFDCIHSELAAILNMQRKIASNAQLINIRILNGEIAMAKPCPRCRHLLVDLNITKVWYTTNYGTFARLV